MDAPGRTVNRHGYSHYRNLLSGQYDRPADIGLTAGGFFNGVRQDLLTERRHLGLPYPEDPGEFPASGRVLGKTYDLGILVEIENECAFPLLLLKGAAASLSLGHQLQVTEDVRHSGGDLLRR